MQPPCDGASLQARRLGLFGGSFDPPHSGHVYCAERAREAFQLDHIVLIPAARPPHKPDRSLASGEDRTALLKLLFEGQDWASVWTGELEREGPSYSLDTARAFRAELPGDAELFWILGSDNLPGFHGWYGAEEFVRMARPIVVHRRGDELEEALLEPWSEEARELLRAGYLAVEPFDVSATELRRGLDEAREELFPARLREYARARGIYRSQP